MVCWMLRCIMYESDYGDEFLVYIVCVVVACLCDSLCLFIGHLKLLINTVMATSVNGAQVMEYHQEQGHLHNMTVVFRFLFFPGNHLYQRTVMYWLLLRNLSPALWT